MGFLAGKRLLITGVLNNRSIAYGIARACHREGAELAFSYQGERFRDRIAEFAAEFGSSRIFECDVSDDAQIDRLFGQLGQAWPQFDGFVHAIAFAPREADAWVEIKDASGKIIFSRLGKAGSREQVEARAPFLLVVGNARYVKLERNGTPVNLSASTKVTVARLKLD